MKWTAATLGLAATAYAASCQPSADGEFEITILKKTSKRDTFEKRACGASGSLTLTLKDGILKDAQGRTGYIASNHQFQFDAPPQENALSQSGWSVCSDGTLELADESEFYQCLSGDFYNLYDDNWAPQCEAVFIRTIPCSASTPQPSGGSSTFVTTTIVKPLPDGQPQVITTTIPVPVTQISDGQIQVPTNAPAVSQISDGQPQVPSNPPPAVTQISDGQPQVPSASAPAVSQISDGQPQVPTASPQPPPVSQISDGQPQVPTGSPQPPPVSQISDGQPQVPTGSPQPPPVTQISDGQIQAPTATPLPPPVTQISDGQIQAPTATHFNPPPPAIVTSAANLTVPNATAPAPSTSPSAPAAAGFKVVPGVMTAFVACMAATFLF